MFKPPSFAAVQNSLQLKILQRGGALGDAQIGWPATYRCDLIVAMLKNDRDGRRRGFRISRAEGSTSETAAEFVRLHRTSLGGKLACRYVAAQRKGSTRTSAFKC
jgi:hypothetical protein